MAHASNAPKGSKRQAAFPIPVAKRFEFCMCNMSLNLPPSDPLVNFLVCCRVLALSTVFLLSIPDRDLYTRLDHHCGS